MLKKSKEDKLELARDWNAKKAKLGRVTEAEARKISQDFVRHHKRKDKQEILKDFDPNFLSIKKRMLVLTVDPNSSSKFIIAYVTHSSKGEGGKAKVRVVDAELNYWLISSCFILPD